MIDFSVCIETAFAQDGDSFPDRIRAAAAGGFRAVEIWDWWTKPLPEMRQALIETETVLHTLCVEHWQDKCRLGDSKTHGLFVDRVRRAADAALYLGTPNLVVLAGDSVEAIPEKAQRDQLLEALDAAASAISGSGHTLLLEVVNREFEGPNALVSDSQIAVDLLRQLNRRDVLFLYDRYHAILNSEPLGWAIQENMDLIGHIHAADVPGRHEFGTGSVDWASELRWLTGAEYHGFVGIEATPLSESQLLYKAARGLIPQTV